MIPELPLGAMQRVRDLADSMMLYVSVGELRWFVESLAKDVAKAERNFQDSHLNYRQLITDRYMRHAIDRWGRPERHTHVDRMDGTDTCAACGRDIRDAIHERMPR